MNKLKIKIPSRLHITLISMHEDGYRQNGGIGFAIDAPSTQIRFIPSDTIVLEDLRVHGFAANELYRAQEILEKLYASKNMHQGFRALITGDTPTHRGFGSSTAVRLALIEGLFILNDITYTKKDIVAVSGRGGVSGIGIETYFDGGFVFDIGRKTKSHFVPSSAMEQSQALQTPLVCQKLPMPNWQIGICIPDIKPKSESEEKAFFQQTCPIDPIQSYEALYHATYGVLASVVENDLNTFAEAIANIQKCRWKNAERGLYGEELESVESVLYQSGAMSVGMSSLGPALYFVGENIQDIIGKASKFLPSSVFYTAFPNNSGREIAYD